MSYPQCWQAPGNYWIWSFSANITTHRTPTCFPQQWLYFNMLIIACKLLLILSARNLTMNTNATDVQYSRWNDNAHEQVTISVSAIEASGCKRVYNKLCTGRLGIAMKGLGGMATFVIIFIIGYMTGYYVHRCK
ncbi:small integral membrane protein 1 [Pristis pectinata]|uniref:small integral membrane protein 1 n=1 Tax=Pristis pectinata TaxID=685728 RepID=UPI00223E3292|nr:small integral membrane protein 1 [Pristis pectinata]